MRVALLLAAAVRYAYLRGVHDAGFLLTGRVHSPGANRIFLANKVMVPRNRIQSEKIEDMGIFVRSWNPILEVSFWGDRGNRK